MLSRSCQRPGDYLGVGRVRPRTVRACADVGQFVQKRMYPFLGEYKNRALLYRIGAIWWSGGETHRTRRDRQTTGRDRTGSPSGGYPPRMGA